MANNRLMLDRGSNPKILNKMAKILFGLLPLSNIRRFFAILFRLFGLFPLSNIRRLLAILLRIFGLLPLSNIRRFWPSCLESLDYFLCLTLDDCWPSCLDSGLLALSNIRRFWSSCLDSLLFRSKESKQDDQTRLMLDRASNPESKQDGQQSSNVRQRK
jgi:hypothetical protein